jgi:hypothetical protein
METLGLDLQQTGNLHRRTQEDCVKHFFPLSTRARETPSFGQSAHQIRKAKHLVEIGLEPVPVLAQTWRSLFSLSFSLRNRLRLMPQMVAAASKRRRSRLFSRTFASYSAGMLRFRLAVDQDRDLKLRVQLFAVGAMTVGSAAGTFAFDKRAGQDFAEKPEAADELAAKGCVSHSQFSIQLR